MKFFKILSMFWQLFWSFYILFFSKIFAVFFEGASTGYRGLKKFREYFFGGTLLRDLWIEVFNILAGNVRKILCDLRNNKKRNWATINFKC